MATADKAGASDEQAGRHEESGRPLASVAPEPPSAGAAVTVPAVAPSVAADAESDSPEVLSPRGSVVVRLAEPYVTSFRFTLGEDAEPVTLTKAGIRVNKAQAQQILETAVAHGVTVRLDPATEESD